jgi:hypothetical protein
MPRVISTIPLHLIDIEGNGFHITCDAMLNGKPLRMLIDTGASKTVFDKTRFQMHMGEEELQASEDLTTGIGTSSMQSELASINNFEVGKLVMPEWDVVVLDMQHVNMSYETIGLEPIDGVLGGDFLKQYKAAIYYGKKQMKFYHNEK